MSCLRTRRVAQARQAERLAALQAALDAKEETWRRLAGGQVRMTHTSAPS